MPLQTSGEISFGDIRTEFGLSGSVSFSNLYRSGSNISANNTDVPTSGAISPVDFYYNQTNGTGLKCIETGSTQPYGSSSAITHGYSYYNSIVYQYTSSLWKTLSNSANFNPCSSGTVDYGSKTCSVASGTATQTFTSSGSWTVPSGVDNVYVMKVDGGRGGEGRGSAQYCGEYNHTAKYGTCGSCTKYNIPTVQQVNGISAGQTISYAIGSGGNGVNFGGNSFSFAVACGNYGGTSTFGNYVTSGDSKSTSNSGKTWSYSGSNYSYTPSNGSWSHSTNNPGAISANHAAANSGGQGGGTSTWYQHYYSAKSGNGGSGRIQIYFPNISQTSFTNQ